MRVTIVDVGSFSCVETLSKVCLWGVSVAEVFVGWIYADGTGNVRKTWDADRRLCQRGKTHKLLIFCLTLFQVAAEKLKRLGECPGAVPQGYRFQLRNTGDGVLNVKCGAEYVQKQNCLPVNFESIENWQRCASVDGDVDRVVYFTKVDDRAVVIDGDRLAALAAIHIQSLLDQNKHYKETYSFGVVLTAYSNNAVIEFLKAQGIEVMIVATGVKNLYAAAKKFHIGIFYEPNGHGSVIFSPRLSAVLREVRPLWWTQCVMFVYRRMHKGQKTLRILSCLL